MVKKNLKTQKGGGGILGKNFGGGGAEAAKAAVPLQVARAVQTVKSEFKGIMPSQLKRVTDELGEKIPSFPTGYVAQKKEIFNQTKDLWGTNSFWEGLQDEPCWIDPSTDSFTLSGLSKLWCKWYNSQGDTLIEGLYQTGPGNYEVDFNELWEIYNDVTDAMELEAKETTDITKDRKKDYDAIVKPVLTPAEPGGAAPDSEDGLANVVKNSYGYVHKEGVDVKKMVADLGLDMGILLDLGVIKKNDFGFFSKVECAYSKWVFCLVFKFLLGPAGILILKMCPHIVKFFITIYDFFRKLFLGLMNTLQWINPTVLPWTDKNGNIRRDFTPDFGSTMMSYLGLVIPWGIMSHKKGQTWGNGEFGKFIFGLVMVSVGLITMGGLSVLVLLTAFLYYCGKTLSMFTSNIEPKKKK